MDYEKFFRELIYTSQNWVVQTYASRLQQAWCTWHPHVREERLLNGHGDIIGLVDLVTGYPDLTPVFNKFIKNEY